MFFNSLFGPQLNNVYSTHELHRTAVNSSLHCAHSPERESTEVKHTALIVCVSSAMLHKQRRQSDIQRENYGPSTEKAESIEKRKKEVKENTNK